MIPNNIRKRWMPGMAVLMAAALCYGCPGKTEQEVIPPPTQTGKPTTDPQNSERVQKTVSDHGAANKAIRDLLGESDSPFPKGTRLLDMEIRDGVAYMNFSKEFNELANSGESVESQAQKALRKALTPFTTIQKMSVKVEGKPFESQATDWATPFPVRDEESHPEPEHKAGVEGSGP